MKTNYQRGFVERFRRESGSEVKRAYLPLSGKRIEVRSHAGCGHNRLQAAIRSAKTGINRMSRHLENAAVRQLIDE
jgi:hypothetical protein